jgi:hypothetical protein
LRAVAVLGTRALRQPLIYEQIDFVLGFVWKTPPQRLAMQGNSRLKQIKRRPQSLGGIAHAASVTPRPYF